MRTSSEPRVKERESHDSQNDEAEVVVEVTLVLSSLRRVTSVTCTYNYSYIHDQPAFGGQHQHVDPDVPLTVFIAFQSASIPIAADTTPVTYLNNSMVNPIIWN